MNEYYEAEMLIFTILANCLLPKSDAKELLPLKTSTGLDLCYVHLLKTLPKSQKTAITMKIV